MSDEPNKITLSILTGKSVSRIRGEDGATQSIQGKVNEEIEALKAGIEALRMAKLNSAYQNMQDGIIAFRYGEIERSKKEFSRARENAVEGFTTALTFDDRVLATKIRLISVFHEYDYLTTPEKVNKKMLVELCKQAIDPLVQTPEVKGALSNQIAFWDFSNKTESNRKVLSAVSGLCTSLISVLPDIASNIPMIMDIQMGDKRLTQVLKVTTELLGSGTFGEVFTAEYNNMRVACKILKKNFDSTLESEVKTHLKACVCAGVVQILAIELAAGKFYSSPCIVMERCDASMFDYVVANFVETPADGGRKRSAEKISEAMRESASRIRLKLKHKLMLMYQVANTLRSVHEMGLLHRDIKLSNILLFKSDTTLSLGGVDLTCSHR